MSKQNSFGFTMIELLVVLVLVGILAVVTINHLSQSETLARNLERQVDIAEIHFALEFYHHTNNHYPADLADTGWTGPIIVDPDGEQILSSATESDNEPASAYGVDKPQTSQYSYLAYQCQTDDADQTVEASADEATEIDSETVEASADEATEIDSETVDEDETEDETTKPLQNCQKYVLYSWLEGVDEQLIPFKRVSLN